LIKNAGMSTLYLRIEWSKLQTDDDRSPAMRN
jgi:hypothetical protein